MGYTARIVLVSGALLAVLVLAIGLAPRRPAAARAAAVMPSAAPPAAQAPRCRDGSDTLAIVANAPQRDAVPLDSAITATFSCPVDQQAVERAFTIYPAHKGRFEWRDQTLIFRPAEPLLPQTRYRVTFFAGMQDTRGYTDARRVSWPFWTR